MPPAEPASGPLPGPVVLRYGEDALLVDLREPAGTRAARRARALAHAILERGAGHDPAFAAAGPPTAAAASVVVPIIGGRASTPRPELLAAGIMDLLDGLPDDPGPSPECRDHTIPVRYGGPDGVDLGDVAAATGLSEADVIDLHASAAYEVLFLGFAPGFGYLGELPEPLRLPRLATPRVRVPAGSVAIAGAMTAAYPQASPGGWRLLGRTDVVLFDPGRPEPSLLRPGDRVRFRPA